MKKSIFILICTLLFSVITKAQTKKESTDKLNDAAEFYMSDDIKDYVRAYEAYDKLEKRDPSNAYYKFQKGLCTFHLPDKKQESITLFETVRQMEPKETQVLLNLGKAYHINYRFDDAIKTFKEFLATNPSQIDKEEAEKLIKNSEYGKNVTETMLQSDIRNIGPPVNTEAQEYSPVISTDESVLIYTYRGPKSTGGLMNGNFKPDAQNGTYYEDVFMSRRNADSTWSEPQGIASINTKQNDASLALSPDGQTLYVYRASEKDSGDIYESHLNGEEWTSAEKMKGNINTNYYEGACSITADGKYFYFSSERPGGFGGRDLYIAEKAEDGTWKNVKNMGSAINTSQDEDSPFIHPDGITLFFSSKGHNSIGDYDIFYTIKKDNDWIDPINMGYPLNTTDDDRYYVINASGQKGYFSSNRMSNGGNGSAEILTVSPGIISEKPVLAMVLGYIYGNDQPLTAQIEIVKKSNGEKIGPFTSNGKTGKYLVALSPGEEYIFHVRTKDFGEATDVLNVAKLTKFVELRKDFHLTKDGYIDPHNIKSLNELLAQLDTMAVAPDSATMNRIMKAYKDLEAAQNPTTTPTATVASAKSPCDDFKTLDFSALKGKSLNDINVYRKLLAIGEKICADKMIFKVQIAAYRHPENYKYDHLKEFGAPEIVDYPDKITRFTQGNFNGIKEAEVQRQKAIAKGQKDAWIVGFIDGKRYTLEELIMVDFYNKNISQFNQNLQELKEYISYK
ncbi:MAG: PD40 domain-containing protein [Bacteroidetes bacterium]|nr:PD40 domain-containing protein [Bacteroidota bacterium]